MTMKNEVYLWVALIAVIIVVALYFRFYSQPAISVKVGLARESSRSMAAVYPQQELFFNISVENTGSAQISDLGLSLLVNGNTTDVYDATVPPGKTAYISINYTPQSSGVYNMTVVADPGKLYNIQDRQSATATLDVPVSAMQGPDAYLSLPPGSTSYVGTENLDTLGFVWYSELEYNYNLSRFDIAGMPGLDAFGIALDYVGSYTDNMSIAHATYTNGSTVYSIWLNPGEYRDVLPADIIGIAAEGLNLSVDNYTVGNSSVELVHLEDNESLCGWDSGGWIKTVTAEGNETCLGMVNDTSTEFAPKAISGVRLVPPLVSGAVIANDTIASGNIVSESYSAVFNQSIDFSSVTENAPVNDSCYGEISVVDNTSYCSSFVFPVNGTENAPYLIRTQAEVGAYNLTLLWRTNNSAITALIPGEITVLQGYNAIGTPVAFKNGIPPLCSVPGFGCANATFDNGTATIDLTNLNSTAPVTLDSLGCVLLGVAVPETLNETLLPLGTTDASAACYNDGSVTASLPTGLVFTLRLNYTEANTLHSANGTIYVVG